MAKQTSRDDVRNAAKEVGVDPGKLSDYIKMRTKNDPEYCSYKELIMYATELKKK